MTNKESIQKIKAEIKEGMRLTKCKKCGCMGETLDKLLASFSLIKIKESSELIQNIKAWLKKMKPVKYACIGCEHCFPAAAMNILTENFASLTQPASLCCNFKVKEDIWPPVAGEYFAICKGSSCPVAVSTLASVALAETLAKMRPEGLCIVGKTETENIGIDKIIKNTITNPAIRYLIVAGQDSIGHYSGKTLLSLLEKGVNENMEVIESCGRRPILRNVTISEIETFREQVRVVDMIGCEDTKKLITQINKLSKEAVVTCECEESYESISSIQISTAPKILVGEPKKLKMDKAGYFVVILSPEKKTIIVEHYAYDNKLLHIVEGKESPSIYFTIIENGWITELSHAAYLGRELAKAELSLKYGFKYIQDKASGKVEENTQ